MAIDKIQTRAADLENLEIAGTEAARVPVGTEAQRANAKVGDLRHNTDTGVLEQYTSDGWSSIAGAPVVSSISPTAIPDTDSSFDITINGSNFSTGATAQAIGQDGSIINATSTARTSGSILVATFDGTQFADAQEDYSIKVSNNTGLAFTYANSLAVNASPAWTTAASPTTLATVLQGDTVSGSTIQVAATDDEGATLTYSLSSGSLPTGLSVNSDGTITGTESGSETYSSGGTTFTPTLAVSDGSNSVTRTFAIVKKWYDGSSAATAAANPQALRDLGITTDDMYYIQQSTMPTAYEMYVNFGLVDSKDWVLVGQWTNVGGNSSPVDTTYTINPDTALDAGMTFKGFSLELGGTNYYGYFSTEQNYSDRDSTFTGTASSGSYSGYRLFLGQTGGHGWYNTSQTPCSWGNSAGSVGAGYVDASGCGDSWPTQLNFGTGISGQPQYNLATGTVNSWIWMDTLGA